jgi:PhnB protein
MKAAHPYLNFAGNTEEAFRFYASVFGVEIAMLVRFRDFGEAMGQIPEQDRDKIAHVALPLGSAMLMATDALESAGQSLSPGNNFSISLEPESREEAERVFAALSQGGTVEMALQPTEWAESFGHCTDRFGIRWMVSYSGNVRFSPGESGGPQG